MNQWKEQRKIGANGGERSRQFRSQLLGKRVS
jgi:hypothetical protein